MSRYDGILWGIVANPHMLTVKRCKFLKGLVAPAWERSPPPALPLGDVDPVALGEVLADLAFLASKGE